MCHTAKPGTVDTSRHGNAGGFKELDEDELAASRQRRRAKDDDGEMYDEFGRLKKKNRGGREDSREGSGGRHRSRSPSGRSGRHERY